MTWEDLVETVVFIVCYRVVLWAFGYTVVKKNKYVFDCNICEFRASTNNQEILTRIRATHTHDYIKKETPS